MMYYMPEEFRGIRLSADSIINQSALALFFILSGSERKAFQYRTSVPFLDLPVKNCKAKL